MNEAGDLLLSLRGWSLVRHAAGTTRSVLRDIDLDIRAGRWLAVLGANGSGKSSLLKFLASDDSPLADQAAIMLQDPDEQIFAAGVDRELTLGREGLDPAALREEFGLAGLGAQNPRLLSAGQKQRLALAVTLGDNPVVLLCDEPTSLQDPQQARWVLDRIDRWRRDTGGALVTATCDRGEAARADDIMVLAEGRVIACGPAAEMLDDPLVTGLLGDADAGPGPGSGPDEPPAGATATAGAALLLQGVGCDFPGGGGFDGIDLVVAPGQRWGLTGINGCGKSTLLAICAGAHRPQRGTVELGGRPLYAGGALDLDHGQALLAPQFPEYLFTRATVTAEITLDPHLAGTSAGAFLEALGLPAAAAGANPHDLSCGQRRRLALGLVLCSGRPVVLLDEPTAALDAAGRRRVLELLDQLPPETALVIASHDRGFLHRAGCLVREVTAAGLRAGEAHRATE